VRACTADPVTADKHLFAVVTEFGFNGFKLRHFDTVGFYLAFSPSLGFCLVPLAPVVAAASPRAKRFVFASRDEWLFAMRAGDDGC
jgi:hypothetical protein